MDQKKNFLSSFKYLKKELLYIIENIQQWQQKQMC